MFSWLEKFAHKKMDDFVYVGNSRFRFGVRLGWTDTIQLSDKQVVITFNDGRVHELNFGEHREARQAFNYLCNQWHKYL